MQNHIFKQCIKRSMNMYKSIKRNHAVGRPPLPIRPTFLLRRLMPPRTSCSRAMPPTPWPLSSRAAGATQHAVVQVRNFSFPAIQTCNQISKTHREKTI
jgi:hypothetical protein